MGTVNPFSGARALGCAALVFLVTIPAYVRAQSPFMLSEKEELEMGRLASAAIEKDIRLIEDPSIVKYVTDLGQALVQKSGRAEIVYTFKVVDAPEINAFALPGGHIYVNRGLIEAADSQNELAGVLAHEIGHVVGRHGASQAVRANMVQTGLGALGGLLGRGTAATVSQTAAQMATAGVFMKFSREAEREADRLGVGMLSAARLQPQAMVSFFDKLASLQRTQPNVVQKFFSSHPSPAERSHNVADMIAGADSSPDQADDPEFQKVRTQLAALPRPWVEAEKAWQALAASAEPPVEPTPEVRSRNIARDREIAARFAPFFHQSLGPAPRFDYITNFDFDGDWRGDNNWTNSADPKYPLKAHVYYAVFETRSHFFIHYAVFHPRDYKGGEKRGALLSEAIRMGVALGGQYDPTGRANEAVAAHENDLEGAVIVAQKDGNDPDRAQLVLVETLAHNNYLKYVPPGSYLAGESMRLDGARPHLFIEPKGHGIEAWRDDPHQQKQAERGFVVYHYTGTAEDPDASRKSSVGYDLLPVLDSFWPRARSGKNETHGAEHDYSFLTVRFGDGERDSERHVKLGVMGSALNGVVGAANMSRPPWGWFDGQDPTRPLGEWFLQPAETIRRRWNLPDSFSTVYTYHPFLGQYRQ